MRRGVASGRVTRHEPAEWPNTPSTWEERSPLTDAIVTERHNPLPPRLLVSEFDPTVVTSARDGSQPP